MARDYHAEYEARSLRAQEHGFNNYGEEKAFKVAHRESLEAFSEEYGIDLEPGYNARDYAYTYEREAFAESFLDAGNRQELGTLYHDYVAWLIDEYGMSEEDAVADLYEMIAG